MEYYYTSSYCFTDISTFVIDIVSDVPEKTLQQNRINLDLDKEIAIEDCLDVCESLLKRFRPSFFSEH